MSKIETNIAVKDGLMCAGCGCNVEEIESLKVYDYNAEDYIRVCVNCVHNGHKGFVYCNCCGGSHEGCWVESNLLEETVSVNDEGQNWICPIIIETFKNDLTKCEDCGRWFMNHVNSIMDRLSIEDDVCYECYSKNHPSDVEDY